ncbi:tubulin-like doman-containing protein [Rubrivirga sp. IMCC43871]|uniref:tubulin-like doman-containing protein n=1 Tax=Rubrivirga sp. IMCC43871 TaxID=3391575 RepID=UPI00398FAA65
MPDSTDKANHLIIGLGGTGGKVIRALRKQVYQTLRTEDPDAVNLRFLYVDTDGTLMETGDPSWKTLGRSVQLPKQSRLNIAGSLGIKSVIDNAAEYPGVSPWLGDKNAWADILQSMQGAQVMGGQKRRLGRFLFANKVKEFNGAVQQIVNEMTRGGSTAVTFHVVCGLAGGTGGGTVVDVLAQLRAAYGDASKKTLVYALLPERNPNATWAGPNYQANGFAALRELNALAIGQWAPHDISGDRLTTDGYRRVAERLDVADPYNVCYLFTDENAAGYRVDVDKALPEVVASFLFHKTVTAADVGASGLDALDRQERYELGSQGLGTEQDTTGGAPARARRFATFGVKTVSYPEEEILEYLTYAFAEQAALQLRHNHWSEAVGYSDQPPARSHDSFVRSPETQNRWRISDAHLTLSEGILDDERANRTWKPLDAEWQHAAQTYLLMVQQDKNKRQWADKLGVLFEKRFSEQFRKQGVQTFYVERARIRKRHVQAVRATVETELFERWTQGDLSLDEAAEMLGDVARELEERHRALDDKVEQQRGIAERYGEKATALDAEFAKTGVIPVFFNKLERLAKEKAQVLQQHYLARTRILAFEFAKTLLGSLRDEFDVLRGEVKESQSTLQQALDVFRAEAAARLTDDGEGDVQKQTVRFYDPEKVKGLGHRLVRDEGAQRTQTAAVRRALTQVAGAESTFTALNAAASVSTVVSLFEKQGAENVQTAHDAARSDGGPALLGVSILDRLEERFGSDTARLNQYFESIVRQSRAFATLSGDEEARAVPGRAGKFTTFTVILPETDEHPEFGRRLEAALRNAVPPGVTPDVVTSPTRSNEIVVLNVTTSMPARYLGPVGVLRQAYEQRCADGAQATLEIHTEHDGSHLPHLFLPSVQVVNEAKRPWLLLGRALDLFEEHEDEAGRPTWVYEILDEDGLPEAEVALGGSLLDAEERLPAQLAPTLEAAVRERLGGLEFEPAAARKAVFQRVVEEAKGVKAVARNGEAGAYADAARETKPILRLA